MIFVYNFLQIILLIFTLPLLIILIIGKKKYRCQIKERLGIGLSKLLKGSHCEGKKVIWMHALSVGEVTSALPLARAIKNELPDVCLIFSATTTTGHAIAERQLSPYVDKVISAPVDLLFTIIRFINHIRPDLFILIETDFWPNWLHCLKKRNIPMMLANGRISRQSFTTYRRFRFFFLPLFQTFSLLSVQTQLDAQQLIEIGALPLKIKSLGNLKYGSNLFVSNPNPIGKIDLGLSDDSVIWICGSTHQGEEDILLQAFLKIKEKYECLVLIIAPRDPDRGNEIFELAQKTGYPVSRRTTSDVKSPSILVLDTIGELTSCYGLAKIAFIGGSLMPFGGHNPLEAAAKGTPVIFGPYMDDFLEIAKDCIESSSAIEVQSVDDISQIVKRLLDDELLYQEMHLAAKKMIKDKSDVITNHIVAVKNLLIGKKTGMNGKHQVQ